MSNRYTRVHTSSQFNPMSLDEIMKVPLTKQVEYETQQSNLDEYGLFDSEVLKKDSEEVEGLISDYKKELEDTAKNLNVFGNTNEVKNKAKDLKRKREEYLGPSGKIGKASNSFKKYQENISNINKLYAAGKITADQAANSKKYALGRYEGLEKGYEEFLPSSYFNENDLAMEYAKNIDVQSVANSEDLIPVGGGMYKYSDKGQSGRRRFTADENGLVSSEQIVQPLVEDYLRSHAGLNSYFGDMNLFDEDFNAEERIKNAANSAEIAKGRVSYSSKDNYRNSNLKQTTTNKPKPKPDKKEDDDTTYVGSQGGQSFYGEDLSDFYSKKSDIQNRLDELNPSAPNYRSELAKNTKNLREFERIEQESNNYVKTSESFQKSKEKISELEEDFKHKEEIALSLEDDLHKTKGGLEEYQDITRIIKSARSKEGYDTYEFSKILKDYETKLILGTLSPEEEVAFNYVKAKNDLYTYKKHTHESIIKKTKEEYIQRQGRQSNIFLTKTKSSERSDYNNFVKQALNSSKLDLTEATIGGNSFDLSIDPNDPKKSEIRAALNGSNGISNAIIGTDGSTPYIEVTTNNEDFNIDGSGYENKSLKVKMPLTQYSNRNIYSMPSGTIGLIKESSLNKNVKASLMKQVMTSSMSSTSDYNKIGDTGVDRSIVGLELSKKIGLKNNEALDLYRPINNGPYEPNQLYIFEKGDEGVMTKRAVPNHKALGISSSESSGSKETYIENKRGEKVKISDLNEDNIKDNLSEFQIKVISTASKFLKNNTVEDLVNLGVNEIQFSVNEENKNDKAISLIKDRSISNIISLIKYMPVMVDSTEDIVNLNIYLENQKNLKL